MYVVCTAVKFHQVNFKVIIKFIKFEYAIMVVVVAAAAAAVSA